MAKIYVNGRIIETDKTELSYHDIVQFAGLRPRNDYSVMMMWSSHKPEPGRSWYRKGQMRYSVSDEIIIHTDTVVLEPVGTYYFDVGLTNNA